MFYTPLVRKAAGAVPSLVSTVNNGHWGLPASLVAAHLGGRHTAALDKWKEWGQAWCVPGIIYVNVFQLFLSKESLAVITDVLNDL